MFKFKDDKCQYCHKTFDENDDIVVCPDCGAPYHRACYNESGKCVRDDLHESGLSYEPAAEETQKVNIEIRCPRCNEPNGIDKNFCGNCGFPLKTDSSEAERVFTVNPYFVDANEEIEDGVTAGDLSKYLGQNSGYFISKYKNMKQNKAPFSINFSALFFNYMYLIYRKGYFVGIALALILGLLNLPSTFVALSEALGYMDVGVFPFMTSAFIEKMTNVSVYTDMLSIVIEVLIAVFFNWFYMRFAIKRVKALKKNYGSNFESVASKSGGVLGRRVLLILFSIYMGLMMISSLILMFI